MGANVQLMEVASTDKGLLAVNTNTSGLIRFPGGTDLRHYVANTNKAATTISITPARVSGYWGATSGACVNSSCVTGTAATQSAYTQVGLLGYFIISSWGNASNGIISRVMLDSSQERCR